MLFGNTRMVLVHSRRSLSYKAVRAAQYSITWQSIQGSCLSSLARKIFQKEEVMARVLMDDRYTGSLVSLYFASSSRRLFKVMKSCGAGEFGTPWRLSRRLLASTSDDPWSLGVLWNRIRKCSFCEEPSNGRSMTRVTQQKTTQYPNFISTINMTCMNRCGYLVNHRTIQYSSTKPRLTKPTSGSSTPTPLNTNNNPTIPIARPHSLPNK